MEHILYDCEEYSVAIWDKAGPVLTHALIAHTGDEIPRINLTPLEIIYNASQHNPSVKIHTKERSIQQAIVYLIQEIKRDIIYRGMNTAANKHALNITRVHAHLLSTTKKIISLYEYQGTRNHQEIINFLKRFLNRKCMIGSNSLQNGTLFPTCHFPSCQTHTHTHPLQSKHIQHCTDNFKKTGNKFTFYQCTYMLVRTLTVF